jgi:hypothetical protein
LSGLKLSEEVKLRIDKKIFGLDVPVNDVAAMAEGYALNHLVNKVPQSFGINSDCVFF